MIQKKTPIPTHQTHPHSLEQFKNIIWEYYHAHKRSFAWRHCDNPYYIIVSEIMLQQTQTHRVAQKYEQFIAQFPTIADLAQAQLRDVIAAWQGLGYNRRAKALHATAQCIMNEHNGVVPNCTTTLMSFAGIGYATASSVRAFAFNEPTVFIETNIRSVFITFFFHNECNVKDSDIMPLVAATVDQNNAREWYYALMDYGVMLKQKLPNPSRKSAHHTKQSKFEGSDRQIRGMILKILTTSPHMTLNDLYTLIDREPHRIEKTLAELCKEEFITNCNGIFSIR